MRKTTTHQLEEQPSARCEPEVLGWDVPHMPSAGFLTAITFLLPALLAAILLSGCTTVVLSSETDKQLGQTGFGIATTISEEGCSPGSPAAVINLDCAKQHNRKMGEPRSPTPVNTKKPDDGDVETTKRLCKRSEDEDQQRSDWIWKVVAGIAGGGAGGVGIWSFAKRFLGGGGVNSLLSTLVDAGECIKKKLPKSQQDVVGDAIREASAKHGTAGAVQDKFVEVVKNGGNTA